MAALSDIIAFRRMVSPVILQVLFWAAIGGVLYGTYVLIQLENQLWPLPLIFGTLAVRVLFERAILAFRSYDLLVEIRDGLRSDKNR